MLKKQSNGRGSLSLRFPVAFGSLTILFASGCDLGDILDDIRDHGHPPGHSAGSGGVAATGAAGAGGAAAGASGGNVGIGGGIAGNVGIGGGGIAGAPMPGTTCNTISTDVGVANHCGRANGVAYSPDGRTLAAGFESRAPNVHLWSLETGALLRDFEGIGSVTYSVAFSPDRTLLATAGAVSGGGLTQVTPDIVKLWDVASGALVRTIPATCGFYADSVAFSSDGVLLATAGAVGPVELWRVADGALVASIPYPTSVHNVHFSPDDSQLIVGGVDRRVTVWKLPEATLVLTLSGTADEMADGAFSPDGRRIATTGIDNVIKIWNATSGSLLQTLPGHAAYVSHVLWLDNGALVTDDWAGEVRLWRADSAGSFAQANLWSLGFQGLGMALSPDRTHVAIAESDGIVFLSP